MEEIKARIEVVFSVTQGICGPLPKRVTEELGYLQLRMICELIALACLVAHGDVSGTSAMRRRYEADWIMNRLQQLHPEFYPQPSRQIPEASYIRTEPITSGYLTREELVALYRECGQVLHRGTVENMSAQFERTIDFARMSELASKIVVLLNHHHIQLSDPTRQYIVVMRAADDGNVHGTEFVRIGDAPLG
jgi:hypothetical protein